MSHPAVAQAAVIAVPDDRWGERPLAVVASIACTATGKFKKTALRDQFASA